MFAHVDNVFKSPEIIIYSPYILSTGYYHAYDGKTYFVHFHLISKDISVDVLCIYDSTFS